MSCNVRKITDKGGKPVLTKVQSSIAMGAMPSRPNAMRGMGDGKGPLAKDGSGRDRHLSAGGKSGR